MAASIFSGNTVKILKNILRFADGTDLSSTDAANLSGLSSNVQDQLDDKIDSTEKGAANGVAELDAGGKVPVSQLPAALMSYEGTWTASTNTPTLADGVGDAGDVYIASDAGTVDFGSGNISFAAGDWVIYNGSVWQKSANADQVVSVNSYTGVVVLDTDDINEGASNLYFTNARAEDAAGNLVANSSTIDGTYVPNTSISFAIAADSITNTYINSAAGIVYSKLNLSSSIVNADIANGAAIAYTKLAALTTDKALVSNVSGVISTSTTTATELGYLSGVTSAVQTQLNAKVGFNVQSISTNTSASAGSTYLVDTSGGAVSVTLPAPALNAFVIVKDIGSAETNNITVLPNAAETIDGASSDVIDSDFGSATYVSDGSDWFKL